MRRIVSGLAALGLAATGAVLVQPGQAGAQPAAATPTHFAMLGSGFGTQARGGDVPAHSDPVAYQSMGCSNRAGRSIENHVVEATLPGAGTAHEVTTVVGTREHDGVVTSFSRDSIERLVFGDPTTGQLEINGVRTLSRAFHGADGFDTQTVTEVGSLSFTDSTGTQELALPLPGAPVVVPGVGTLSAGNSTGTADADGAKATADALRLDLAPSGTVVRIAHSRATISRGVKSGLFGGRSAAVHSTALAGNVSVGYQPLTLMPCQGTDGELRTKETVQLGMDNGVVLHGLTSREQSDQTPSVATAFERGRVDTVDINGGMLLINKVIGRVEVTRKPGSLTRSTDGTTTGEITYQGEPQEFDADNVIEIPGVARLERNLVTQSRNGISIIALRVTLLDGVNNGAVIDLGLASTSIAGTGL